jgi:hypothetical protein
MPIGHDIECATLIVVTPNMGMTIGLAAKKKEKPPSAIQQAGTGVAFKSTRWSVDRRKQIMRRCCNISVAAARFYRCQGSKAAVLLPWNRAGAGLQSHHPPSLWLLHLLSVQLHTHNNNA